MAIRRCWETVLATAMTRKCQYQIALGIVPTFRRRSGSGSTRAMLHRPLWRQVDQVSVQWPKVFRNCNRELFERDFVKNH